MSYILNLRLSNKKQRTIATLRSFYTRIMKGISIKEFGESNVCKFYTDLPVPEPLENQVLFKLKKKCVIG